jgi:NADH:ubiquinone oxidoreductase subunit E
MEVAEFCIEGRFLNFVIKDGYKLKGLLLGTAEGECYVKLAKHLRAAFDLRLPRGTWLQVIGTKKQDQKSGKVTLKAERVMAARLELSKSTIIPSSENSPSVNTLKKKSPEAKATILVCQKSDCMKRGGRSVCQALEATLSERGLADQVTIKGTGCMKNCKSGPNLVMPDKTRYSKIQATQVPAIIDQHLDEKFTEKNELYRIDSVNDVAINMTRLAEATS